MTEELGYICPQTKKQCDDECCVSAEDCHAEAINSIISNCEPEQLNKNKMTAVEKAFELILKIETELIDNRVYRGTIKKLALIQVDEIMKAPFENSYLELVPDDAPDSDWYWDEFRKYWEEVKHEINNL